MRPHACVHARYAHYDALHVLYVYLGQFRSAISMIDRYSGV